MPGDNAALVIAMDLDWSKADAGFDAAYQSFAKKAGDIGGLFNGLNFSDLLSKLDSLNEKLANTGTSTGSKNAEIELQNLVKATAEAELAQLRLNNAQNKGATVAQGDSYKQLSQNYRELARNAQDYAAKMVLAGDANFKADAGFQQLQQSAKKAYAQLSEIDQSVGKFGRNVGNYSGAISGAFNQTFTRTVHAGAEAMIGMQRGVNALAVDLPNLIHQFMEMDKEQKALKASGESYKTTTQLLAAAFNPWTVAMQLGIMLLVKHGGELWNWATGAEEAKKKAEALKKSHDELNEAFSSTLKSGTEEIANLKQLATTSENTNLSMKTRLEAVKKMKDEYPDLLKNYRDEDILNKNFADTLQYKLIPQLKAAAMARAYGSRIDKLASQELDLKEGVDKNTIAATTAEKAYEKAVKDRRAAQSNPHMEASVMDVYKDVEKRTYKELQQARDNETQSRLAWSKNQVESNNLLINQQKELEKAGNAASHAFGGDKGKSSKNDTEKNAERIAKRIKEIKDRFNQDKDFLSSDLSEGIINKEKFDKKIIDIIESTRKELKRLHVPESNQFITQLLGDEKKYKEALNYIQKWNDLRKAGLDTGKLTDKDIKSAFPDKINADTSGFNEQSQSIIRTLRTAGISMEELINKSGDELKSTNETYRDTEGIIKRIVKQKGVDYELLLKSLTVQQQIDKLNGKQPKDTKSEKPKTLKELREEIDNMDAMLQHTEKFHEMMGQLGSDVASGLVESLIKGESVLKSMSNIASSLISKLAGQAAYAGIMSLLGKGTGGSAKSFADFFFGRATGGTVLKDQMYRINENGPEIFSVGSKQYLMPSQNGSVQPITAPNINVARANMGAVANTIRVTGDVVLDGHVARILLDNYDNLKRR